MPGISEDKLPLLHAAEWEIVRTSRANLLIEGGAAATLRVLMVLQPHIREPIAWRRTHAPLELPSEEPGALILEDALAASEQSQLVAWLDDGGTRTQVVSTADQALFPRVAAGLFDRSLYYRLNVVRLLV